MDTYPTVHVRYSAAALRTDLPTPLTTPCLKRSARLSQAHPNPPWSSRVCVHQISGWLGSVQQCVQPCSTEHPLTPPPLPAPPARYKPSLGAATAATAATAPTVASLLTPLLTHALYVIAFSDNPPPRGPHLGQKVDARQRIKASRKRQTRRLAGFARHETWAKVATVSMRGKNVFQSCFFNTSRITTV